LRPDLAYRVLSDLARLLATESDLTRLLESIADAVEGLIPCEGLVVFHADPVLRSLRPILARHPFASDIYKEGSVRYGEGLTGFGAENREAVLSNDGLDPRSMLPGMSGDESLISVPLVAHGELKGMLNLYRFGPGNRFDEAELELASRFAELAALAFDNSQIRTRLEAEIVTDHLTGLYNHRYFQERLGEEVRRAVRLDQSVALVVIDVDNFSRINEQDSPLDGDHVLAGLGALLRVLARPEDVICRLGGEEFAIVLPGATSEDAVAMAERLRERIAEAEFNGVGTRVTVSIGVAEGPANATGASELLACANNALLQAKTDGKNRVSAYVAGEWEGSRAVPKEQSRLVGQLKVLQGFAGKLNQVLDVQQIGGVLMDELKTLVDYDAFRLFVIESDGVTLRPIAFHGQRDEYANETEEVLTIEVGQGITGRAAETGESIYAPDAMDCDMAVDIPGSPEVDESVLAVPLKFGSRVIGVIVVSKLGLARFDADDLRVMEALASHVAVAIENARLFERERQSAETANALLRVSKALTRRGDVDGVLNALVGSASDLLGAKRVSVWLRGEDGAFRCLAEVGNDAEAASAVMRTVVPAEVANRHLLSKKEPFFMPEQTAAEVAAEVGITTKPGPTVVAPITWEPDGVAAIFATGPSDWRIGQRHLSLARGVADMASLALGNAHRFADLEKAFMETVDVLANALEAKDSYTHGHARQVAGMALAVGAEMGMDEDGLRVLELAGIFHDIGKIGVATNVIAKRGALDADEWERMREHSAIGDQIMAPVEFMQPIRPLIRSHHERWDGNGYPSGLSGEEIPLGARIIAVCDAWHAMISDRPYRKALPEKEALRRLREGSGSQFDPAVIDAFLAARGRNFVPVQAG
jgi:diguanylate cyclase (GGDEF)-like protein